MPDPITTFLNTSTEDLIAAAVKKVDVPARPIFLPWRFLLVVAVVVALAVIPVHIDRTTGFVVAISGLAVFAFASLSALMSSRQALRIVGISDEPYDVAVTVFGRVLGMRVSLAGDDVLQALGWFIFFLILRGLQRVGASLVAASFFVFWALIYMLLWAANPTPCSLDLSQPCSGAFRGLGSAPTLGSFLYYAFGASVASNPPDVVAGSSLVRAALMAEVLSALAVLGTAARFVGWTERSASTAPPGPRRPLELEGNGDDSPERDDERPPQTSR